ncbi:unnamed protein product [Victoria cruziana]
MKVDEVKAEVHFQDQFPDSSLTDPVKKQVLVEDYIAPAGAEETEEKHVISISQDHPGAGDQLKNRSSHARDEPLTTISEPCDAAIHHLLVEEKAAGQVAGSVSKEAEGSNANHEPITILTEAIVIDKSSGKRTNISGAEMPPSSTMLLEDEGFIYLNLKEAECDKSAVTEKETVEAGDHREREMTSSPYADIDAKDVKSFNQIRAQSITNDQVDENTFQEKQDTELGCEHEENIRSHSVKSESDEPEMLACEPLVQLEDGEARTLSKSSQVTESFSQHNDDIQIKKHIQNMVVNIVEDRHGAERRERKDQSNAVHGSKVEEREEGPSINEDDMQQTDVPAIDTTAHEGEKESSQPMIVSLMLDEMAELKYQHETLEDVHATYFTPKSQSQPPEFSSDNKVDNPKEESREMSSAVETVPPCPTVCEMNKGNGATDGLEENFPNVQFSGKETDQSEIVAPVAEDKTEVFPRSQDDSPDQESKEVVPSTPRISQKEIEKDSLETPADEQRGDSEMVNRMRDGDMKGFPVKEDDRLPSKFTVKHDLKKFPMIEDEPEVEVCRPTDGAVNGGSATVKDDVLAEQTTTTDAAKSKDDALEENSESDLFGQPDYLTAEKILAQSDTIIHYHCEESQTQKRCPTTDRASLTDTTNDITTGVAPVNPIPENKISSSIEEDVNLQKILDSPSQKIVPQTATQIGERNDVLTCGRQSSFSEMNDSGEHLEEAKLKSDYLDQRNVSGAEKRCLESDPTTEEEGNCNEKSDVTACTNNKGTNAETASTDIDESQNSDSAKVSACEGSESGKLRSPVKVFFKMCTASRPIKEERRETSNIGDSLTYHLEKMSLPSSGGREKQKTWSIFTSCMCCTAAIH